MILLLLMIIADHCCLDNIYIKDKDIIVDSDSLSLQ